MSDHRATGAERAHFALIARVSDEEDDARLARAASESAGERMLRGMRLGAALPFTPAIAAENDARADGQMELARRRIARGLDRRG